MASFHAPFKSAFSLQSKKKTRSRKLTSKSRRPLLAETLEGRWMLDATITTDNNGYYPNATNALTAEAFNESETIAPPNGNPTFPPVGSTVNLQTGKIGIFYTDETPMTLGVTEATVNGQVYMGTVSPMNSDPGEVVNPLVGVGGGDGSSIYKYVPPTNLNTLPIQAGTDPSGRPMFPSLYVTDITGLDPNSVAAHAGDWQFGGTPQSPNAVFGAWTYATETINGNSFSFTKGPAPAKNGWNLGPGADPAPTGSIQNQGYGAEAQWTLGSVVDQNGNHLIPGHSYRFYFIVHDGDQNKTGGDVGQAAFDLISPLTPSFKTTTGGDVIYGSGTKLTDSATLSGGNNPTGTITFHLFAPGVVPDATYSNAVYSDTVQVSGNGTYNVGTGNNPGGYLPTGTGTYEWIALYSGDKNNSPAATALGDEPEKVIQPTPPTISTTPSPGPTVVLGASKLNDTATLTGTTSATSTVTFYLFAPGVVPNANNSNSVYSDTVNVNGSNSVSTAAGNNPGGYMPTVFGTYNWLAVYSDANTTVSSKFTDEQQLIVSPPAISTFEGGTLHLGSGGKLYDSAQLQGGVNPTGTITFYLFAPGVTPNGTDSNNIYSDTVPIDPANPHGLYDVTMGNNPGGIVPTQTGTYQWVAVYSGDANNPPQASQFGDEPQQVVLAGPTITTVPGPSVVFGSGQPLTDTATLAGGTNPTGTITFYLFAPNVTPTANYSNNIYSDVVTVTGDGNYSTASGSNPGGHVPGATGTYQWIAVYSGDANNSSAATNLGDEPEKSRPAGPTITTVPGPSVVFGSGQPLTDTATLAGGTNPTGTITFYLFAPNVTPTANYSNNIYSDVVTVTGDGNYSTATGSNPGGHVPGATGTYQWIAVYSGDANNSSAATNLGDEPEKSTPAGPTVTTVPGPSVVFGSGQPLTDTATLSGGSNPTGTITFYLFAPNVTPTANYSNNIYSNVVTVTGDGNYSTASGNNPGGHVPGATGTYQWIAVYSGDTNNASAATNLGDEPEISITPASPTITTVPGGSVVFGSGQPLTDTATLAGGTNPTGTITFYLFAPNVTPTANYSNNIYSDVVTVTGDGNYSTATGNNPGGHVPGATGTYQWISVYSGDVNNSAAATNLGDEPETSVTPPAISTFEGGTLHLGSGGKLFDSAQLQGGLNLTGTITFYLFAPGVTPDATDSNNIYADTVTIDPANPHGLYDVTMGNNPGGIVPTQTGTYQWVAVYSGDANNPPAASQFGDEPQKVIPSGPSITTNAGGSVVLGSGAALSDAATLTGGTEPTGSITFYLFAPGVTPNATDSNNVYSNAVTVSGNGTYTTAVGNNPGGYLPTAAGTYEWIAVYSGDANNSTVSSNFGDEPQVVTSQGNTQVVVFKIADQAQIDAGQTAGFTIKILNEGANTATGLTLNDALPAGVAGDINWQIDSSGAGFGAGTNPSDFSITGAVGHQVLSLASSISTLAAGASISVHVTGQTSLNDVDPNLPPCTTTLVNTATVNAANEPANEQNAQATATVTLHNVDVDVSKTADQTQVVAGQMAGFTIQVYNQGCVDAEGLTLNDQLSAGAGNDIFWRLDPTQGSPEFFQIVGQIGSQVLEFSSRVIDLQPGTLISAHIIGQTSSYDVGTINNTVTVNASNEPSFEDNAHASATINIVQNTQNNATALYVQAAFEQTIYRAPDQASLQAFVNALNSGAMSRSTFAMTLLHSTEYYNDVVSQAYEHFLGRTPDAQGLQYWSQQLANGLTDEQLEAQFIGSSEYYQVSGNTDKAWVDHMYFDLLGRTPDNQGENYWVQALANGASRSAVALGFAASAEREGEHVKEDYEIFLGRLPAQSEIDSWVAAFESGMTNEDVIAGFIAAPEYYNRHS